MAIIALLVAVLLFIVASDSASAAIFYPEGKRIIVPEDSNVTVEFESSSASYNNSFGLWSPTQLTLGTSDNAVSGTIFGLGHFSEGTALIFFLSYSNTWVTGPGSRNADGQVHASIIEISSNEWRINFEDGYNGGDRDFDDVVLTVKTENTSTESPRVDIEASNSDGPITIPYNSSALLEWTSDNVTSCYASGDWSGNLLTSGSRSTSNLLSSKTYTITCYGSGGTVSDNVRVNIAEEVSGELFVKKAIRKKSVGGSYLNSISVYPNDLITYSIEVKAGDNNYSLRDVIVKDVLPDKIVYQGNLKINGVGSNGNLTSGLNLGSLSPNQTKVITFDARIAGTERFGYGQTIITNGVSVQSGVLCETDLAKVTVVKGAVAGAATVVSTGLTNNLFLDSFFIPLLIALLMIWIFKSRIINFEEWMELRKEGYQDYKSKKMLQFKVAQIKTKEFFTK